MFDGYVRVTAATPRIKTADVEYNALKISELMSAATDEGAALLCLPELCLTGYTCGDLFFQKTLQQSALTALCELIAQSSHSETLFIVGTPFVYRSALYNAAAVFCRGELLGVIPKTHVPNYNEFYELRHFAPAPSEIVYVSFAGRTVPFGADMIFTCSDIPGFNVGVEICEDLWAPNPPSIDHAIAGATVIANLSASDETIGKASYRRSLVSGQSARLVCAYVYADAGYGESTTDMTFAGHNIICENGATLGETALFAKDSRVSSEIDLFALKRDRQRMNTFARGRLSKRLTVPFSISPASVTSLSRKIDPRPFVPNDTHEKGARCEEILSIQSAGLAKRLEHTACDTATIGVSGGLDSCLALIAVVRAFNELKKPLDNVVAVTMPCFGTSGRTKTNAHRLCEALRVSCREIDITDVVKAHLKDIEHNDMGVVYENAQARVRTLTLMDLANKMNGIVIGTGDLSELALGWATYNGDHMSMYAVNAGVPKTLVRHIVRHVADTCGDGWLTDTLNDILDTPVSPELLPPSEGEISQKTEELIGPYDLHDFFLYHVTRWGRAPSDIYALAILAFSGEYSKEEILKWLRVFYKRFFAQQFKRSCLPDGPKIGSVSLSPRSDWRMPSDASVAAWLKDLDAIT
ncbi:MAG: NAD(+) synthase [Clostridiales bacterium]|jgi:NAD+ synthase (glutamine-hydrolysing)|nr:NAD(+) synthase [Clostridiales bacterium]